MCEVLTLQSEVLTVLPVQFVVYLAVTAEPTERFSGDARKKPSHHTNYIMDTSCLA